MQRYVPSITCGELTPLETAVGPPGRCEEVAGEVSWHVTRDGHIKRGMQHGGAVSGSLRVSVHACLLRSLTVCP